MDLRGGYLIFRSVIFSRSICCAPTKANQKLGFVTCILPLGVLKVCAQNSFSWDCLDNLQMKRMKNFANIVFSILKTAMSSRGCTTYPAEKKRIDRCYTRILRMAQIYQRTNERTAQSNNFSGNYPASLRMLIVVGYILYKAWKGKASKAGTKLRTYEEISRRLLIYIVTLFRWYWVNA